MFQTTDPMDPNGVFRVQLPSSEPIFCCAAARPWAQRSARPAAQSPRCPRSARHFWAAPKLRSLPVDLNEVRNAGLVIVYPLVIEHRQGKKIADV